jgi:hypothetical protein
MLVKYNYLVSFYREVGETPEQAQALAWDKCKSGAAVARLADDWSLNFSAQGVLVFGHLNKTSQKWLVWRTDGSSHEEGYGLTSYYEELTRYGAELLFY